LEKIGTNFQTTELGHKFSEGSRIQRFEILFDRIASLPVFREAVESRISGNDLSEDEIAESIAEGGYNPTTSKRRFKTVNSWVKWLWDEHARLTIEAR